jgi:hypothetical protein
MNAFLLLFLLIQTPVVMAQLLGSTTTAPPALISGEDKKSRGLLNEY